MDIRRIEQFLSVARHGSFGRAASSLRLTQPSLTRAMAALEADLGAQLFDRGPRGATLTESGVRFMPRARAIVDDYARAVAELDPGRAKERQQIRIGVSPNFLDAVLAEVIAGALSRSPRMNVQVTTATAEALRSQLRSRDIDVALHLTPDFPLTPAAEAADLQTEIVGSERIVALATASDPAATEAVGMEELCARVWAVPNQMSLLYRFESAFDRRRLPVPVQGFNGASLELALELTHRAGLLAMLPSRFAAPEVAAARLIPLDCAALEFSYAIALVRRRAEQSVACLDMALALRAATQAMPQSPTGRR